MTIAQILTGPRRDLGGFTVSRMLPQAGRRMVGPFIFFDQMGPAEFAPGHGIDVRPHPHIGLATVTYLFEGAITHRDSLGTVIDIAPGAVNWMTAGRGITHSERSPDGLRAAGHRLHGIQSWVALPQDRAEDAPEFVHHPADTLPQFDRSGAHHVLIAGTAFGHRSPVAARSPMFYLHVEAPAGAIVELPDDHEERAVHIVHGAILVDGVRHEAGAMLVFEPGTAASFTAVESTRAMLLGGAKSDGPRHIFWNFVHASNERIEQAKADWRAGRFPQVPGETEFIPLPDDPPGVHAVSAGSPTS
jgi:redox-sensitive bicupin YhaK (pirin superfamily)